MITVLMIFVYCDGLGRLYLYFCICIYLYLFAVFFCVATDFSVNKYLYKRIKH